ncbi:MAG: hypothetical protein JXR76_26725 [Deltaproteobacteria bacterium]|nr:hypothetical protein [Deltaproteobacteria bacterium]
MTDYTAYNRYLFNEFEFNSQFDISKCTESWPFRIHPVGNVAIEGVATRIFQFGENENLWYLVDGESISVYHGGGLNPLQFKMFLLGNIWLGRNQPIDLHTSILGDSRVPATTVRKENIRTLVEKFFPGTKVSISEGLLLKKCNEYVALVIEELTGAAHVIGNKMILRNIPFENLSPWKRLSIGIGTLISKNLLR